MSERLSTGLSALGKLLRGHLSGFRASRLQDLAAETLRAGSGGQRWVLPVVNATLRARRTLTYLLVLRPRSFWSWCRYRAAHRGPQSASERTVSLLCPSRERVGLADAFLRSVVRTAERPDRVEVLFYVDEDDPDLESYRTLVATVAARLPLGACAVHVGPPEGVSAAWNTLATRAGGELMLMANDDQLYVDHGWDVTLDATYDKVLRVDPDGVRCLYFDAGRYPTGTADFPIVTRAWYRTLGYFTPTMFAQWEVENWVFDIARRIDRLTPVPGVFVEHRHYAAYKAPFDATYQRHRLTRDKAFADHTLFLRTSAQREAEATRLRNAIDTRLAATMTWDPGQWWFVAHLRQRLPALQAEVLADPIAGQHVLHDRSGPVGSGRFPITTAVLGEIPEASTISPGSAVLHRVASEVTVRQDADAKAVRMLVGVSVSSKIQVRARGLDAELADASFLVLDGSVPFDLCNEGPGVAALLVIDVPRPE